MRRLLCSIGIVASFLMFPSEPAHAQSAAPLLREIGVPAGSIGVKTDGAFMVYHAFQGGDLKTGFALYAVDFVGGAPILLDSHQPIDGALAINHGLVAWSTPEPDSIHIRARDLYTGASFELGTSLDMTWPQIQGKSILWEEQHKDGIHIMIKTLPSEQAREIDSPAPILTAPRLWGDSIVWSIQGGQGAQILRRNIRTMEPPQVIAQLEFAAPDIFMVSDAYLGWTDFAPLGPSSSGRALANKTYIHDLRTG